MASAAEHPEGFWPAALRDLAPFPGRAAMTWRIALVCALTSMTAMVYGIPEAAISCYLIFFVMKPDGAESMVLAVALSILASLVVVLLIYLARWTIVVPALRLLTLTVSSLLLLYLASASKLGPLGGIVALVLAFAMTLLGDVPFGEVATRGILYAWLMAIMPMAWVLLTNLAFGRKPLSLLRAGVVERLEAAAALLERGMQADRDAVDALVGEGQGECFKRWQMTRAFALARKAESKRVGEALQQSYRLLCALLALEADTPAAQREAMAQQARAAAAAIGAGAPAPSMPPPPALPFMATQAWEALRRIGAEPSAKPASPPAEPFMSPDAASNPAHLRYAIKTTAAAVTCYLIYTALDWQGIHTAMITCYVAALGSVAETAHKLLLRIIGCLIGAAMGIGAILFLIPHMTSVGSLMLLVFAGSFVAAWVAVGSERVSYGGVQIALAFLMTVLQGFGPSIDMGIASDRIIGILLGNVVLYLVFVQFWPVSIGQRVQAGFGSALARLSELARQPGGGAKVMSAASAIRTLAESREALALAGFEPHSERLSATQRDRLSALARSLRELAIGLRFEDKPREAEARRLGELAAEVLPTSSPGHRQQPQAPHASLAPSAHGDGLASKVDRLEALVNGR